MQRLELLLLPPLPQKQLQLQKLQPQRERIRSFPVAPKLRLPGSGHTRMEWMKSTAGIQIETKMGLFVNNPSGKGREFQPEENGLSHETCQRANTRNANLSGAKRVGTKFP